MKRFASGFAAIVGIVLLSIVPTSSHAASYLAIDVGNDGSFEALIQDNGPSDMNPLEGGITFFYSYNNISFHLTSGLTKPILGTTVAPRLDLTEQLSSNGPVQVRTIFMDDGFNFSDGLLAAIGGTAAGTVEAAVQFNSLPLQGAPFVDLINLGSFGPGPFSGSATGLAALLPSDFLAVNALISQDGDGVVSSFDVEVKPVPEPGTMMLLSSGLVGLAGWRRNRFRK